MGRSSKNPQIYVAGFSRRTNEDDLEDSFRKYGKIRDVVIKKGYAFIEFDDYRDAEDAVDDMDGRYLDDHKLTVQIAGQKLSRNTKGPQENDKCYKCGKTGHW